MYKEKRPPGGNVLHVFAIARITHKAILPPPATASQ